MFEGKSDGLGDCYIRWLILGLFTQTAWVRVYRPSYVCGLDGVSASTEVCMVTNNSTSLLLCRITQEINHHILSESQLLEPRNAGKY